MPSKLHPGFSATARNIARHERISVAAASAILAGRTRVASPAARRANPRLNRVPRRTHR